MNCRNWMDFVRFVFFAILDLQVAWPNSYVRTLVWGPWDLFGLARLSVVSVRLYQSVNLSILTRGFLVTGAQCWWLGKLRRHTWACCHCNRWWQHPSIPGRCVRRASLLPCLQRPDRQARVGWHNLGHCESWECLQSGPCGKALITLRLRTKDQKITRSFHVAHVWWMVLLVVQNPFHLARSSHYRCAAKRLVSMWNLFIGAAPVTSNEHVRWEIVRWRGLASVGWVGGLVSPRKWLLPIIG